MKRTRYPKSKKLKKAQRPWLIIWVDARGFHTKVWWYAEDRKYMLQTANRQLYSVGWIFGETKHAFLFRASNDQALDGTFAYGECFSIPKGCIKSMRQLK